MKNPYLELYKMMAEATEIQPSFFIGKIKSISPFTVNLSDIVLDSDDLLIDSTIMKLHNASIKCSEGTIEHNLKDELKVNDKVVMLRIYDKFIIISKVVAI